MMGKQHSEQRGSQRKEETQGAKKPLESESAAERARKEQGAKKLLTNPKQWAKGTSQGGNKEEATGKGLLASG